MGHFNDADDPTPEQVAAYEAAPEYGMQSTCAECGNPLVYDITDGYGPYWLAIGYSGELEITYKWCYPGALHRPAPTAALAREAHS